MDDLPIERWCNGAPEEIPPARHGADWHGFYARTGRMPLDFSSNVNPLGMSPAARIAR